MTGVCLHWSNPVVAAAVHPLTSHWHSHSIFLALTCTLVQQSSIEASLHLKYVAVTNLWAKKWSAVFLSVIDATLW